MQILLRIRHRKFFFHRITGVLQFWHRWTPPSRRASLDQMSRPRKIVPGSIARRTDSSRTPTNVIVHRFEETICGRAYQIEVTAVSNRWRAQLRRLPGMPTAMMPFYGQTPDEAARLLTQWLVLTHRRLAAAPSS